MRSAIMKHLSFLLFLLSSVSSLWGQQIRITGTVLDAANSAALPHVIVLLKNDADKIVHYTQTDEQGKFAFALEQEKVEACTHIQFMLMSYEKCVLPLKPASEEFTVSLKQVPVKIKEVTIKARRIGKQGDTLTYNVASFATESDRSIGDVLKKMPGITLDEDGTVKYNGRGINKFYIEGKDLLEGRYSIATRGISHKDIGRVEVMENHQPIRVLEDFSFSDRAAINLKLKETAKAQWTGNAKAEGGFAWGEGGLWNAEALGMMISRKFQNITTLKSNNTGDDITTDIRSFYPDAVEAAGRVGLDEYINLSLRSISDLERQRTLFNHSHLFSTNQLWETSKSWQLKVQANYLNNTLTSNSGMDMTYFLSDGDKVIAEQQQAEERQHVLNLNAVQELNKQRSYVKHSLAVNLKWNDIELVTSGTYPNRQDAHKPVFGVKSNLAWKQRIGKHLVTFSAVNQFNSALQQLSVWRGDDALCQHVDVQTFHTHESAGYNIGWGNWVFTLRGGLGGLVRSFNSRLQGLEATDKYLHNDLNTNYFQLNVVPQLQYSTVDWVVTLNSVAQYYHYNFRGLWGKKSDLLLSPSLSISWSINPRLNVALNASIDPQTFRLANAFDAPVLSDYRTLRQGYGEFDASVDQRVAGMLQYRHTLSELFANVNVERSWNKAPFQSRLQFVGDYLLQSYDPASVSSDMWFAFGNISKGVGFLRGYVDLSANFMRLNTSMVSGSEVVDYRTSFAKVGIELSSQPLSWFDCYYKGTYGLSMLESDIQETEQMDSWSHLWGVNFFPVKGLSLKCSGEYYHNEISSGIYRNFLLVDAGMSYKWKEFEVSVRLSNLFNKREYGYTFYTDLSSFTCRQQIRGREFLCGFSWRI